MNDYYLNQRFIYRQRLCGSKILLQNFKLSIMDIPAVSQQEEVNKKKGIAASTILHIILLILAILPFMTFPDPPPGQSGVLVAFGDPDAGEGSNMPDRATSADTAEPVEAVEEEVPEEVVEEPKKEEKKKSEPKKETKKKKNTKVNSDKNSKELALKKARDAAKKKQQAADAAKAKREADARKKDAAKKKAAEDAKKAKAAAEAKAKADAAAAAAAAKAKKDAEAKALKDQIGGLFGSNGNGNGDNGKPGSQGSKDGDPDKGALEGMGTGVVGGGISNRGGNGPKVSGNFKKPGKIVMKVCVSASGKVVSASFTQKGSNSNDPTLIKLATANAKKWSFKSGDVDRQCGTITYNFKLK